MNACMFAKALMRRHPTLAGRHRALGVREKRAYRGDKKCRSGFPQGTSNILSLGIDTWLTSQVLYRPGFVGCRATKEQ